MGDLNAEVLGDETMNGRIDEEFFVEGLDDTADEHPEHRHQTNNSVRH